MSFYEDMVPGSKKVTPTLVEKPKATRAAVNKRVPDRGAARFSCVGGRGAAGTRAWGWGGRGVTGHPHGVSLAHWP